MRPLFTASVALVFLTSLTLGAPSLGDKPKWEYAELTFRTIPGRQATVDADGNEIPATPATMAIVLTTGAGQVQAKSWFDLSEKLKIKGVNKDSAAALQKIQILNSLGGEGWEVLDQQVGGTISQAAGGFGGGPGARVGGRTVFSASGATTMLLKRRAP
jgi:hypothetical protein